jgi:hypothetical protein
MPICRSARSRETRARVGKSRHSRPSPITEHHRRRTVSPEQRFAFVAEAQRDDVLDHVKGARRSGAAARP